MYHGSNIGLKIKGRYDYIETFLMVRHNNVGGSHFEKWVCDGVYWRALGSQFSKWEDHQPIMRHLADMTPEERMDIIQRQTWYNDYEEHRLITPTSEQAHFSEFKIYYEVFRHGKWLFGLMDLRDNKIELLVELIRRGFDLFGLIEAGQAIRKEVQGV